LSVAERGSVSGKSLAKSGIVVHIRDAAPSSRSPAQTDHHLENQLAATNAALDEIQIPPGTTINPVDNSSADSALEPATRRRQGAA
jgi:hypothetical protein